MTEEEWFTLYVLRFGFRRALNDTPCQGEMEFFTEMEEALKLRDEDGYCSRPAYEIVRDMAAKQLGDEAFSFADGDINWLNAVRTTVFAFKRETK